MARRLLTMLVLLIVLPGCAGPPRGDDVSVLIFSRTVGFCHDSIPAGAKTLQQLCFEAGYACVATENAEVFTPESLANFRVVVFLSTTGDILDEAQQRAFETWWKNGNGFVGIHSAADTEYDWPFYQSLLGAHFTGHPPVQPAVVMRERSSHPAVRFLPARWERTDEWYNYDHVPDAPGSTILLTLDTASYEGSTMADHHPIAWCRQDGNSRMVYTGGGHTTECYSEPLFRQHLLEALRWAAHHDD